MNFRKTAILAIVLCFLILIFYLMESPLQNKGKEEILLVPGFAKEETSTLYLNSPEKGELIFQKKEGSWAVEKDQKSYPADSSPIDKLLSTVGELKIETIASKNPSKHEVFEVTEGKGIEVKIEDDAQNILAHFYVGKSGPDLFSTYVRQENASQVILTSGLLKVIFDKDLKDWRDKTIFDLPQDIIVAYEVKGDRQFQLKKTEDDRWEITAPEKFKAKKETVEDCLKTFAKLEGADFAQGPLDEFQLDKPVREVVATFQNGETKTLLVGKEKNTFQHFVKKNEADTIFVVENYGLEKLTPELEKFKEEDKEKEEEQPSSEKPPVEKKPVKK
jgi:hypothetical protein